MPELNPMVTVGDTYTVKLPKDKSVSVAFALITLGAASGTLTPEVSYDDGANYAAITGIKPDTTAATTLTAAGASSWQRLPGATHVRLRLTAITTPTTGLLGRINPTDGI